MRLKRNSMVSFIARSQLMWCSEVMWCHFQLILSWCLLSNFDAVFEVEEFNKDNEWTARGVCAIHLGSMIIPKVRFIQKNDNSTMNGQKVKVMKKNWLLFLIFAFAFHAIRNFWKYALLRELTKNCIEVTTDMTTVLSFQKKSKVQFVWRQQAIWEVTIVQLQSLIVLFSKLWIDELDTPSCYQRGRFCDFY